MLQTLKDAITDPTSNSIEWVHTAAEIVEGTEVVMAAVTGAGATAATQGLVDLFEGIEGAGAGFAWPITTGVAAIWRSSPPSAWATRKPPTRSRSRGRPSASPKASSWVR